MNSHSHTHSHDQPCGNENNHQNDCHDYNADEQEKKHQKQVKSAFANYAKDMRTSMESIYSQQKVGKYFQLVRERKRQQMDRALEANQRFLNLILQSIDGNYPERNQIQENNKFVPDAVTMCHNISKIRTTVKQFFRQWCSQSPEVKDYLYLVQIVKKYLKRKSKLLVPGCGLARLPMQLIEAGYHTQGNQVTYFMLYGSNFILNCTQKIQQYEIFPFIHTLNHHEKQEHMFRSVRVPDKLALDVVPEDADFSMAAGQFTQIYQGYFNQFDGVVTCFFIDTANNVFQYIDTIYQILKNQGIWINYGPLLYHFKDMLDQVSIQLSWEQVMAYARLKGFILIEQQKRETTYCHDPMSTYAHIYDATMTVWRKTSSEKAVVEQKMQESEKVNFKQGQKQVD